MTSQLVFHRAMGHMGGRLWSQWHDLRHTAAVIGTALIQGVLPRNWKLVPRILFARQVMAIAVEPLAFVGAVAAFVGIAVVVQFSYWTGETGQSHMLGPLLITVVARELGPVLINLIVIIRSGSAMTTELGILKLNGQVAAYEAHGNDPFLNLVLPRVLGMAVSTFCLTIVFILAAFASGYLFAAWLGKGSSDFSLFANTISRALQPREVLNILAKSILPALFASASCCIGGLGVGASVSDIPQATQCALTRSVAGLFVISGVISLLAYL